MRHLRIDNIQQGAKRAIAIIMMSQIFVIIRFMRVDPTHKAPYVPYRRGFARAMQDREFKAYDDIGVRWPKGSVTGLP